jgi:hypothetical protein
MARTRKQLVVSCACRVVSLYLEVSGLVFQ